MLFRSHQSAFCGAYMVASVSLDKDPQPVRTTLLQLCSPYTLHQCFYTVGVQRVSLETRVGSWRWEKTDEIILYS